MEVIIVDDSGENNLEPLLAQFRNRFCLISLGTPHLGPAPARQAGIDLARGKYLVFTDDDCIPDTNWLMELQRALDANPGCAIGGIVTNGLPENAFATASQILFDYFVGRCGESQVDYVGTGNAGYPADGFRTIGGLDRRWQLWGGEDRDLCRRWRASGRTFLLCPSAVVRHFHPLTLRKFWNQQFRYGRGASRFHRESRLQRPGFYTGLVAAGFRGGLLTGVLTLLSQAAIACGFFTERLLASRNQQQRPHGFAS